MGSLSICRDGEVTDWAGQIRVLGIARLRCRSRGIVRWGFGGTDREAKCCRQDQVALQKANKAGETPPSACAYIGNEDI